MDTVLGRPRSSSAVGPPRRADSEETDLDGVAQTPATAAAARANVPPWYRGLHQSIRTMSQSGLDLDQVLDDDEDVDNDNTKIFSMHQM